MFQLLLFVADKIEDYSRHFRLLIFLDFDFDLPTSIMMKPEETPKKNPFLTKHQQKLMKEAEEALTVAEKEEYLKTRKWREASLWV